MIILNPGKLKDGKIIMHLHIEIDHPHGKHIFMKSGICYDKGAADELAEKWLAEWMRMQLKSFVNQREKALEHAKYIHLMFYKSAIAEIREYILPKSKYEYLCKAIEKHQTALRTLFPSNGSAQACWISIIEVIIHHAHEYKDIHQQYERSFLGSAQLSNKTESQIPYKTH